MESERMIETTMTVHTNGEVDVPMKIDGVLYGTMTIGKDFFAEWVALHKVEMKEIISVDTANIVMWLKNRR